MSRVPLIGQAVPSTLDWISFYAGIRTLRGGEGASFALDHRLGGVSRGLACWRVPARRRQCVPQRAHSLIGSLRTEASATSMAGNLKRRYSSCHNR